MAKIAKISVISAAWRRHQRENNMAATWHIWHRKRRAAPTAWRHGKRRRRQHHLQINA